MHPRLSSRSFIRSCLPVNHLRSSPDPGRQTCRSQLLGPSKNHCYADACMSPIFAANAIGAYRRAMANEKISRHFIYITRRALMQPIEMARLRCNIATFSKQFAIYRKCALKVPDHERKDAPMSAKARSLSGKGRTSAGSGHRVGRGNGQGT